LQCPPVLPILPSNGQERNIMAPTLKDFLAAPGTALSKGPLAMVFAEDETEIDSTLRHHLDLGFRSVLFFAPDSFAAAPDVMGEPTVHRIRFDAPTGDDPVAFGREVLAPFQIRSDAVADGFLPAFSHIFSGGYAAGYYSYLWSEMLDADAFSRFRDEGIYDPTVGEAFRRTILARGNSAPPESLIRAFLGRDPDPEALLARNLGLPAR